MLSYVACMALQHFSTLSDKSNGFRKKLLDIKCVFSFPLQILPEIFLILRRTERDIITQVHRSSCKVPVVILRPPSNLNFLDIFSKNPQVSNAMKIRPLGADLLHTGGPKDVIKDALRSFANPSKNCWHSLLKTNQISHRI